MSSNSTIENIDKGAIDAETAAVPKSEGEMFSFHFILRNYRFIQRPKIQSPIHEFGGFKWRLIILPLRSLIKRHLSVYLECVGPVVPDAAWSCSAHFYFQLVHPSRWNAVGVSDLQPYVTPIHQESTPADIIRDTARDFCDKEREWGFREFVPFNSLQREYCDEGLNVVILVRIYLRDLGAIISYDSPRQIGYVGLKNQGATAYLNSALQNFYMLDVLRKALYAMPPSDAENSSSDLIYALQSVFYQLQCSPTVVETKIVTAAFGWGPDDVYTPHDFGELFIILLEFLAAKNPNKIQQLFEGKMLHFIEGLDVDFMDSREETFWDLSLRVKRCRNIYKSFDVLTECEVMDGDNKFRAKGFEELQRARKGLKFLKLPPILHLRLQRFEYDFHNDAMVKLHDRYEFFTEIDLSPYVEDSNGTDVYVLHSVTVHNVDVYGGHYHIFIRKTRGNKHEVEMGDWLKFDDEHVSIADENEALNGNFGCDDANELPPDLAMQCIGNLGKHRHMDATLNDLEKLHSLNTAYMLQYIRKSDVPEILKPLEKEDIPAELAKRVCREQGLVIPLQQEELSGTCSILKADSVQVIRSVLSQDVLDQAAHRRYSTRMSFGNGAFVEACKGLSRILIPNDPTDLELFREQLENTCKDAIAENHVLSDREQAVVFALSYVQHDSGNGRFKFSEGQWECLKLFMKHVALAGVQQIRFWYDQCLWLRDESQSSWAHIGILPYTIYPTLSLGLKSRGAADRTLSTYERFWPFVEEIAALWGAGLYVTRELRDESGPRENYRFNCSYNIRDELPPNEAMWMVLLNIFHGAADLLKTGWTQDRTELQEMARKNVLYGGTNVAVGADWKIKLGVSELDEWNLMGRLVLEELQVNGRSGRFLDGARRFQLKNVWRGIDEFLSGNQFDNPASLLDPAVKEAFQTTEWFNLATTDDEEFQLIRLCERISSKKSLWLLIKMHEKKEDLIDGRVAWLQIVHGKTSAALRGAIRKKNFSILCEMLREQLGNYVPNIQIRSWTRVANDLEPTWKP